MNSRQDNRLTPNANVPSDPVLAALAALQTEAVANRQMLEAEIVAHRQMNENLMRSNQNILTTFINFVRTEGNGIGRAPTPPPHTATPPPPAIWGEGVGGHDTGNAYLRTLVQQPGTANLEDKVKKTRDCGGSWRSRKGKNLQVRPLDTRFKVKGHQGGMDKAKFLSPECGTCGKTHRGPCRWDTKACFRCGKLGHPVAKCTTIEKLNTLTHEMVERKMGGQLYTVGPLTKKEVLKLFQSRDAQVGQSSSQFKKGATPRGKPTNPYYCPLCARCKKHHVGPCGENKEVCFKCGKPGHYAKECKWNAGHASAVNVQQSEKTSTMVEGIMSINLIDCGITIVY